MPKLDVSSTSATGEPDEPEVTEDSLVAADGYSATEVFGGKSLSCVGYTYDDIILLPGHINFGVENQNYCYYKIEQNVHFTFLQRIGGVMKILKLPQKIV